MSLCSPLHFVIHSCFATQKAAEQGCINHKLETGKVGIAVLFQCKGIQSWPGGKHEKPLKIQTRDSESKDRKKHEKKTQNNPTLILLITRPKKFGKAFKIQLIYPTT